MSHTTLVGERVLAAEGARPAQVRIDGDLIGSVTALDDVQGHGPDVEVLPPGSVVVPGFIDIHVHGGGGHDMAASPDSMRAAVDFHRAHGTTSGLVSLVTAPVEQLCRQLGWAADLAEAGLVAGAHLEGPFLSHVRCGAQNPAHLKLPDTDAFSRMYDAARGHLRMITIAPELPGALPLVEQAVAAGVVVAVGHTDATYTEAEAAYVRGATVATHLFNGMRPVHHREPGPVLASLDAGARCEVINDGIHVHPAVLREVLARGADRLVLVTDAIDATGVGDGSYELGGQQVTVSDGAARLDSGSLAGSTLTMDRAVRRAVKDGIPLEQAVAAAARNPAAAVGLDGVGAIAPGARADLVVLDAQLRVTRVMRGGQWIS
ncbi:N-acetylglucosamine-6-phosphate deacetylase [Rudaeicoccus suwonensis]|uniref:N-acetylglucosamine 6-phosphate deacetylase n=1 Tax=Rudaeicoccus suwonensis TaxID=657409 RepID=A0A561EBZ6_9MICO|nr:N-acetylglucosamine-6-phosphate deacetylase [Rudaeicoccus suwonensis]TWE13134.1 N-acetylglucosamine 6-phosphate deacetylase [Rudaeicoccus suwonensis]